MTKKRLLILTTVILGLGVGIWLGLHFLDYRYRLARNQFIDGEHCLRIKKGMRQDEVEEILGGPEGDFTTTNVEYWDQIPYTPDIPDSKYGVRWGWWTGDNGEIMVLFDENDVVILRSMRTGTAGPSLNERARHWLLPPTPPPPTRRSAPTPWTPPETPPSAP
jgi:hypothetical protein